MSKHKNNFIVQGSILAIAGILVRIIGIVYRIPLYNILGDEGIGYYTAAYDIYSILLLLSSQSIPIAVSKIVSAQYAKKQHKNATRIFIGSFIFAVVVGLIAGAFTYVFADKLALIQGYPPAATALKVLAPTLFIMALVGTLRGYFQGIGTMIPTAVSQILEQISNAIVSVAAAAVLYNMGKTVDLANNTTSTAAGYSAAGGTLGTCIGALTALIFLAFLFVIYKPTLKKQIKNDTSKKTIGYQKVVPLVVVTIIPVLLSTTIYNFSNLIDSAIYGNIMKVLNVDITTRSSNWGIYSGKYRLLTTVPIAIASSLSASIIPSISGLNISKNKSIVVHKIRSAIQFTMIIAIPCAIGLTALSEPIIKLLFGSSKLKDAVYLMYFAIFTVITFSLSTITNSALQGINRLKLPVRHASISLIIHLIILPLFLYVFHMDIYGVVISDFLFAGLVCYLNQNSLRKYIGYRQEYKKTFILPLIASLIMGVIAFLSYKLIYMIIPVNIFCTFIAIIIGGAVYFALILLLKIVDETTLYNFPKGKLLVIVAKRFHLL